MEKIGLLENLSILLGVSGSIAAYKAADLASKLHQAGANVDTVLTKGATELITPLTFQSVTGQRAYTDEDLWGKEAHVLHIGLARRANLMLIAPASANTMAKIAHGFAGDLLSLTALALENGAGSPPLFIAPAMDGGMFANPATQANCRILEERGAIMIGPEAGHLASGLVMKGRMTEPLDIIAQVRYHLSRRGGSLHGINVVITAGGTAEPIDPVRLITNRSSGKQGLALAQAALDAGANVTLIATSVVGAAPFGVTRVDVETAAQMEAAVLEACQTADVLLMAAAVADFRPKNVSEQKIKKHGQVPEIILEPTGDILQAVHQQRQKIHLPRVVVGFAAETQDLVENAHMKLAAKGLDMIIANDVSLPGAGFGVDTNIVTLLDVQGGVETLPLMSKASVAERIITRVVGRLHDGSQA